MAKHKIVIVGGGFGGIKAALELASFADTHVTLISDQKDFRYYPSLYHAATGGSRTQSVIPLEEIFTGKPLNLMYDHVERLDRGSRQVTTVGKKKVAYDTLILALGVMTNYFDIKGLEQYSYGIKSIEEATGLKHHLHQQLIDKHKPDFNYVVIGGGPTGVELAGALPAYIKHVMKKHGIKQRGVHVDLIEAAPRLMPRLPKDVSLAVQRRLKKLGVRLYLSKTVEGETIDSLMVDGKPIPSSTVIWTAGVTNNPFFKENDFALADKGKVKVDEFLRAEHDIFVIGDNADTPYSGMAQTALQDAKSVADNMKRQLSGSEMQAYKPKKPVYVTPVGPRWAAVLWGSIRIYGITGWALRRAADFIGYHNLEPWWKASRQWLEEDKNEEDCAYCAVAQET